MVKVTDNRVLFDKYGHEAILVRKLADIRTALIDLGSLQWCQAPGIIKTVDDGTKLVVTQEAPQGHAYPQDWHVVVRLAKVGRGTCDAYAIPVAELAAKVDRPIGLMGLLNKSSVTDEMKAGLRWLYPYVVEVYSAKPERRCVLMVTDQMIGDSELQSAGLTDGHHLTVYNSWGQLETDVVPGDAIVVEDLASGQGYRIDEASFWDTHIRA